MEPVVAEWRAAVGGQLETRGHGILDLGWRQGPTSIQLLTDTFDLRTHTDTGRGRITAGFRAATFAAGMWISPWSHGRPDPARAQRTAYLGPDLRMEAWLPRGAYVAVEGFSRYLVFAPLTDGRLDLPDLWWTHAGVVAGGWWHDGRLSVELSGGFDVTERVAPYVAVVSRTRFDGNCVPLFEMRAGVAAGQDDIVSTRLGGLTPYHVPLAGAAWAEFWVEDYAMTRAGVQWRLGPFSLAEVVDFGVWNYPEDTTLPNPPDSQGAYGFAAIGGLRANGWFVDTSVGWAPALPRRDAVRPVSVYLLFGTDWLRVNKERVPPTR